MWKCYKNILDSSNKDNNNNKNNSNNNHSKECNNINVNAISLTQIDSNIIKGQRISSYTKKDPEQHRMIIVDSVGLMKRERNFNKKGRINNKRFAN